MAASARALLGEPAPAAFRPRHAFDGVYAEHFAFVWRCLRGLGLPPRALEDAAQDVFVVVHRRLREFRGDASIRTWLYGIARRVAANYRRSQKRASLQGPLELDLPSPSIGPLEHAQDTQAALFMDQFLAGLDETKRDLVVLVVLEELPVVEVASELGIPLNTAYTWLRRTRLELEAALAKKGKAP